MKKGLETRSIMTDVALILVATLFLSATGRGMAVTYYVAPGGDDSAAGTNWHTALRTITNAVAKVDVTEIVLTNGTHFLTDEVSISKAVTVRGMTTNRNLAIVNGNYPNTTNRCFYLSHGSAILKDITITNGFRAATDGALYSYGGGVYVNLGKIKNCLITGNIATNRAGGVYLNNSGLITNSAIVGNHAMGATAGGIYAMNNATIIDSVISNNVATGCGGIEILLGARVINCKIVNNTADTSGGGIRFSTSGGLVTNSLIAFNKLTQGSAAGGGGGVYAGNVPGTITHSLIIGNDAGPSGPGGGITFRDGNQTVYNTIIVSNISSRGGGVAFHTGSTAVMQNCLIAFNISTNAPGTTWGSGIGGGVFVDSQGIFINCTVAGNSADTETGGVRSVGNGTFINCVIYNNFLHDGSTQDWHNTGTGAAYSNCVSSTTTDMPGSGNIPGDPRFVDPATGNFRLRTRSPCINAGLNQTWMDDATDLDGNPRRHDGTDVDIGAYEYIPPPSGTLFMGL